MAVTSRKANPRRWMQGLNKVMPVLLDMTGIILLSGAAMLLHLAAGVAALGVGVLLLNRVHYGD
jgi:hypothetical protein